MCEVKDMSGFLEVDSNAAVCSESRAHLYMCSSRGCCLACLMHDCMLDVNSLYHNHCHHFSIWEAAIS